MNNSDSETTTKPASREFKRSTPTEPSDLSQYGVEPTAEPKPLRPMPSWIAYGNMAIDPAAYHIGDGFLEVGCFIMLIGQSYAGKSTLLTQLSIYLAIGRSWLFFRIKRPLRVLVVQAEDPINKRIKMGRMYRRMSLTEQEIALADKNIAVLTIRDLQDQYAIREIDAPRRGLQTRYCLHKSNDILSGRRCLQRRGYQHIFAGSTYTNARSAQSQRNCGSSSA